VTSAPAESVLGFFGQLRQRGLLRLLGPLPVVIEHLRVLVPDDPYILSTFPGSTTTLERRKTRTLAAVAIRLR